MIETELLQLTGEATADRQSIARAGALLAGGGTVIVPTETVYGLAANALDPAAVARIFAAKGRPQDNPLIVHISRWEQLLPLIAGEPPQAARLLAQAFWPGPLTMILPKSGLVPTVTSGGLETVAIRLPSDPVARAVIDAAGVPLAAPSANRSGSPSPTTAQHCIHDMLGRVDAILCGGDCTLGVESTVVSLCGETPRLLRPGAVTPEQLQQLLGTLELDPGVEHRLADNAPVSSPGMKYKHYAPAAQITLLRGETAALHRWLADNAAPGDAFVGFQEDLPLPPGLDSLQALCYGSCHDPSAQAHSLFGLLRQLDDMGVARAYIHAPSSHGVGLAVYNRLLRAAAFHIVDL